MELSPTEIVELEATVAPEVDPRRRRAKKDSVPSVLESLFNVTAKEPELSVIDTDPPEVTALAGELKSELLIVPETPSSVQ
jgi:hypothetical protein